MDARTVAWYDDHAAAACDRYEAADLPGLHARLLRCLPPGASVLEIGCGSGRDAVFLLSHGYDVSGVDASAAMIAEAARLHPELAGRLACAAFPLPEQAPLLQRRFDAVISIAALMHVPEAELEAAAAQVRILVRPGGILFLDVSRDRPGLREDRDGSGRLFVERLPDEYRLLFERHGFSLVAQHASAGSRSRPRPSWVSLAFDRT
jgi:SAM-dependent methyltransferase